MKRVLALLLCLSCAPAARAQEDGGVVFSHPVFETSRSFTLEERQALAKEIVSLRAENESLKKSFDTVQAGASPLVVTVIVVLALGSGFAAAKLLK